MAKQYLTPEQQAEFDRVIKAGQAVGPDGKAVNEEGLYEKALVAAEVDVDAAKRYDAVQKQFVLTAARDFGEKSIDVLAAQPDLQGTSSKVPLFGRDNVEFNMARSKEVRNVATGETSTVHGNLVIGVNNALTNRQAGEYKALVADLKADAAKRLTD